MTPRWMRIAFLVFGVIWLILGTLTLAEGDTGTGVIRLAVGTGWLLVAAFKGRPSHADHVESTRNSTAP